MKLKYIFKSNNSNILMGIKENNLICVMVNNNEKTAQKIF
jgi:hypothetical protein